MNFKEYSELDGISLANLVRNKEMKSKVVSQSNIFTLEHSATTEEL